MASKNSNVYLGYIDDQVNSNNQQLLNHTVSKVGGYPDWCSLEYQNPLCKRCRRKLTLVVQLYAPLEGSPYHRTLYVFACVNSECWSRSESWICYRRQVRESWQDISSSTNESWPEDDVWEDTDNGNCVHPTTDMFLQYISKKNMIHSAKNENANERQAKTADIPDVMFYMEAKLNLNEGNVDEPVCGAIGAEEHCPRGMEATAVIEDPEGDVIAIESPNQNTTDIPSLFKKAAHIDTSVEISFIPYFISICTEPTADTGLSEHESELLLQYTQSSSHEPMEEGNGGDAVYEKTMAHHGDIYLHKFKKRISRSPQQIIRYIREEGASPLWIHPPGAAEKAPRVCLYCGSKLAFEVQIMPQLISFLKVVGGAHPHSSILEFGTVIIYTCWASCWKEGDSVRQEDVVVQGEQI